MTAAAGHGSTWNPPSQVAPHIPCSLPFSQPKHSQSTLPHMKRQIPPAPPLLLLSTDAHQIVVKIIKTHKLGEVSSPSRGADASSWPGCHWDKPAGAPASQGCRTRGDWRRSFSRSQKLQEQIFPADVKGEEKGPCWKREGLISRSWGGSAFAFWQSGTAQPRESCSTSPVV